MKITILPCLLFLLFAVSAFAQNDHTIKGVIADSVEHVKLRTSSVAVLRAKDSILVKFAYAESDGSFAIAGLKKGKFILLVSYPDYED